MINHSRSTMYQLVATRSTTIALAPFRKIERHNMINVVKTNIRCARYAGQHEILSEIIVLGRPVPIADQVHPFSETPG